MLHAKRNCTIIFFFFWGGDKMQNHHFSRRKSGEMLINGKIFFFEHLTVSWKSRPNGNRTYLLPFPQKVTYARIFVRGLIICCSKPIVFFTCFSAKLRTLCLEMFTNNLPFIAWDVHFSVFYGTTLLRWTIKLVPFSATTTKRSYLELNFEQILLSKWK